MIKLRSFLAFLLLALVANFGYSQINSVNYQLSYDTTNCWYDVSIVVNSGSATTSNDRLQRNSQVSIVVPFGVTISIDSLHAPYVGNIAGTGGTPMSWFAQSSVNYPDVNPTQTFYSIVPTLSPASRYNNITQGQTVKLFSFSLDTVYNCTQGVRLWENNVDPSSSMISSGTDFNNGFTMGPGVSVPQLYNGNSSQIFPPSPLITLADASCNQGIEIDLEASTSSCQTPLTYSWTGPDNYVSTTEDVAINPATVANSGVYKVIITDEIGCVDSLNIVATSKPDAGADQTLCAGSTFNVTGLNPSTGTWRKIDSNAGGTVTNQGGGQGLFAFTNTASGTYTFVYEVPGCSDTMNFTINPLPTVSITGDQNICVGNTSALSPTTGGTWVSSNPSVATVTNDGTVTAISSGTAFFTFTDDATTCTNTTGLITVNPGPNVSNTGQDTICIDNSTLLSPNTGGSWTSLDPTIATVTNSGDVDAVSEGTVGLIFNETSSGCVSDTIFITVRPKPVANITGSDSICIFGTTTLSPNTGGTWTSSNTLVATVNNSGLVTGRAVGSVTFTFTDIATQCISEPSDTVRVLPDPVLTVTGPSRLCIGDTTFISPTENMTFTSSNPAIATVTSAGEVIAVTQGVVVITGTNSVTGCTGDSPAIIIDPKPTVGSSQTNICIGASTPISPSTNGTWTNHTPSIVSYSTVSGEVTGLAPGTGKLTFLESGTGCESDTLFVTVEPGPTVNITGDDEICVSETTNLSPTSGGTWTSSNPSIATVNNSGLVTGVAAGVVTFTYTSITTFCTSAPTDPITVIAAPIISLNANDACVGETVNASPNSGGVWTSSNPSIASITNAGVISAIAAGSTTFTFTNSTTLCSSNPSSPFTVNNNPTATFTGPATICEGSTTTVGPVAGGVWVSDNPSVALVTNTGVVTAVGAGTATLTYTDNSTGCSSNQLIVTVEEATETTITGDTVLCIGETSTITPSTGGSWSSSNTSVATINNAGLITAVGQGTATFTYINQFNCPSDPSQAIEVNGSPTVDVDLSSICIGDTAQLTPATGGTWTADNPGLVNIIPGGQAIGLSAGTVTFTFLDTVTGCASASATDPLEIEQSPTVSINGPSQICIGSTTNLTPSVGGSWTSSDVSIATISNSGLVTGISPGKVVFTFTDSFTGCTSAESDSIEVTPGPVISIIGPDELCIGETTTLSPNSGGVWTSSNTNVATITNSGIVTAVGAGNATFVFEENGSGCQSEDSDPVVVNGRPTVSVSGSTTICKGGSTQLSPSTGGTWASNDVSIATVTDDGVVTGVSEGTVTFVFTDTTTNCPSDPTEPVTVSPAPDAEITGPTVICVGSFTTLSPTTGGVWTSSNSDVASVTNDGVVTAHAPGIVNFSFQETATGCSSESSTGDLTIENCTNPDFNSTFVNIPVDGDVSTNDNISGTSSYGPVPVLIASPAGSVPDIDINPDGTYQFTGNVVGVYVYEVPVCFEPFVTGCPTSLLTISVVDNLDPNPEPVANVDIATTEFNTSVDINTLANDRCIVVTGCSLDAASVSLVTPPSNGSVVFNSTTGVSTYTPNSGFLGKDTLRYSVCVDGDMTNCDDALQIITVNALNANNSTVAADDYAVAPEGVTITGNVSENDSDPEGDNQTVTANTITNDAGTLTLLSDGSYTFEPATDFFGPVDFPYTTCDDNTTQACADATLHILVVPDLGLKLRVYLEGPLISNGNARGTTHTRHLMRDNLRSSPFNGVNYLPTNDPYQDDIHEEGFAYDYQSFASFVYVHTSIGDSTIFFSIPDPGTVFGVQGEDAIVDWVFVELRDAADITNVIASRAGLLQRDGDVVDLDGKRSLRFPDLEMNDYYISINHRSHLGIVSSRAMIPEEYSDLVDFSVLDAPIFDFGLVDYGGGVSFDYTGLGANKFVKNDIQCMWAGDFDFNNKIKATQPADDINIIFSNVIDHPSNTSLKANFDFAYGYRNADYDMNAKVKFDNPNDDKNFLFGQLLFYPLNTSFLANFDFFIQQIPE